MNLSIRKSSPKASKRFAISNNAIVASFVVAVAATGCSDDVTDGNSNGTGGKSGTGGNTSASGSSAAGATSTGGTNAVAGSSASAVAGSVSGNATAGGASSVVGGTANIGGVAIPAGAASIGGITSSGGAIGVGGAAGIATSGGATNGAGARGAGAPGAGGGAAGNGGETPATPCTCDPFIVRFGTTGGSSAGGASGSGSIVAGAGGFGGSGRAGGLAFEAWSKADRSDAIQGTLIRFVQSISIGYPYTVSSSPVTAEASYELTISPEGAATRGVQVGAIFCGETELVQGKGDFIKLYLVDGTVLAGKVDAALRVAGVQSINVTQPQNVPRVCFRQMLE